LGIEHQCSASGAWRDFFERRSRFVVHRAGDVAQELRLPQVELALDVTARLVDQLATLQLAEDVATLGVDELRLATTATIATVIR
jgi:hypothetical protein